MSTKVQLISLIKKKYNNLSVTQKKAADYIFNNPEKAAFNTAVQIGIDAGVSDSTVIRLSYALGFRSFSEMQEMLRKQIMDTISNPNKGNRIGMNMNVSEEFTQIIENQICALQSLYNKLDASSIHKAAEAFIEADQILVMGYYSAFTVAYNFYLNLEMMRKNVFFYRTTETEIQRLYNLTDKSVVMAVSFPRHVKDVLRFINEAKKQGARVISITDSELSPVCQNSDIPFVVDVDIDKETGLLTAPAAMTLHYLIAMDIKNKDKENVLRKLNNIRTNLDKEEVFY